MTITIGSFTCNALTAQPFGYEGEARDGLTARTFRVAGLLTTQQWNDLLTEYNTWRDTRITDVDTLLSGEVGTTVTFAMGGSGSYWGPTIEDTECWFVEPPSGEQAGAYVSASAVLVDAEQALEVLLRSEEKSRQRNDANLPDLGTVTVGNTIITLTKPMDTRQDGPQVTMTAGGVSYITGALKAHKVRDIEGYVSSGSYSDVLSWYDTTISSTPATDTWFPLAPPTATAEPILIDGVKSTRYSVALSQINII